MSAHDRLDRMKRLLPSQFEELLFRLAIPISHISSAYAPQAQRATEALRWVEQNGAEGDLDRLLGLGGGASQTSSRHTSPSVPDASRGGSMPSLKVLRREILKTPVDASKLRFMVQEAGLQPSRINLAGSLEIQIHNVLDFAKRYGGNALERFCAEVVDEYPDAALPNVRAVAGVEAAATPCPEEMRAGGASHTGTARSSAPTKPRVKLTPNPDVDVGGGYQYHAFVSFSSKDRAWVETFVGRLREAGLKVWFDDDHIEWGETIRVSIKNGIKCSRRLIAVLSPDYVDGHGGGSGWIEFEHQISAQFDPANRKRRLLPLLYRKCEIPDDMKPYRHLDVTEPHLLDAHFKRIVKALRAPEAG